MTLIQTVFLQKRQPGIHEVQYSFVDYCLHERCSSTVMVNSNLKLIQHKVQWLQAVPEQRCRTQPLLLNAGAQARIFICETFFVT